MYKIKSRPEDFKVFENMDYELCNQGNFVLCRLKKNNYNTMDAISFLAKKLRVQIKEIGFCGNKDKIAITEQYLSFPIKLKEKLKGLVLENNDLSLKVIGNISLRLNLGGLKSNSFEIVVRNLENELDFSNYNFKKIPNYFGRQRFGSNNANIGKMIVKDDFKSATDIILKDNSKFSEQVKSHLKKNPKDFAGAIQQIPKNMLKFYMHAYQSLLWNWAVDKYVLSHDISKNRLFPVIGFGTEFQDEDIEDIYEGILDDEEITQRDFIIKKIKEISSEGDQRNLFLDVNDFAYRYEDDELNKKKKKCILSFELGKGNYATVLIDYLFCQE